jgi:hypothetical protein
MLQMKQLKSIYNLKVLLRLISNQLYLKLNIKALSVQSQTVRIIINKFLLCFLYKE